MGRPATKIIPEVSVVSRGVISPESRAHARRKILALARQTDEPIRYVRVRLTQGPIPTMPRPAVAQANLDVNGHSLRAHVAAATIPEAIDLLQASLRERLAKLSRHWEAWADEWRHGSESTHRPDYYPRSPDERQIVRHKAFTLARETPDEAAFDIEVMDYGFLLFTDAESGQDSVIYRDEASGGYRVAHTGSAPSRRVPVAVPLTTCEQPPPRLSVGDVVARLNLPGPPFMFFVDEATGRGNVLYRRYDGHYGLITPVAAVPTAAGLPGGRRGGNSI